MAETNIKDVNIKIGTEKQFQEKSKDLPINTLVGTTDPIQEDELDPSIITKLDKAENSLPKPTNDTTGTAGQVLKKTANGSEWVTIKGLPAKRPAVGEVLGCITNGTPAWVGGAFEYNHYMSFKTASGEGVMLIKTSSFSDEFYDLADAYQREIDRFQDADWLIPVVGIILSEGQKFPAVALNGEGTLLYGGGKEIDISNMTEWTDVPIEV